MACFPMRLYNSNRMKKMRIGFIGTGHMGSAIARRLSNNELFLFNRTKAKAEALAKELGPNAKVCDPLLLCEQSQFVFLGVKPSDMKGLLETLSSYQGDAVFVSMAAGITLASLKAMFPNHPFIRIMPNTPVEVGKGLTFVCFGKVEKGTKDAFESLMAPCGQIAEIPEEQIDAASVLTGSAPAYLDYFLDALSEAGVKLGLSKEQCENYVLQMAEGTIALAKQTKTAAKELGKAVCSPGGSTIEGVEVLLQSGMYENAALAASATYYKNRALGGLYPFYGSRNAMAIPTNKEFEKVLNPYRLYDLLSGLWSVETCAPRMRKDWSKANKTLGQCSITSFLVQDIFGGEVYGIPLGDGSFHCFNKVGDKVFDLTSEQFLPKVLEYTLEYPQSREAHFSH